MLFATWFGWPLEYTRSLPYQTVLGILAMRRGEAKANEDD